MEDPTFSSPSDFFSTVLSNIQVRRQTDKLTRIFLHSYHCYCTPLDLWNLFCESFNQFPKIKIGKNNTQFFSIFLKEWISLYAQDDFLSNPELVSSVVAFVKENIPSESQEIQNMLKLNKTKFEHARNFPFFHANFDIFHKEPHEIALHLTHLHAEMFQQVPLSAFLIGNSKKEKLPSPKSSPTTSPSTGRKIHTKGMLEVITSFFNVLSNWVPYAILTWHGKTQQIITFFINVCLELKKLGNFHILQAILSGVGSYELERCTKMWINMKPETLRQLKSLVEQFSPTANYKQYRALCKSTEGPKLPCLSVITRDLTVMREGNANFDENGNINFEKCKMIASELENIHLLQTQASSFILSKPATEILNFFHALKPISIEEIHELSNLYIANRNSILTGKFHFNFRKRKSVPDVLMQSSNTLPVPNQTPSPVPSTTSSPTSTPSSGKVKVNYSAQDSVSLKGSINFSAQTNFSDGTARGIYKTLSVREGTKLGSFYNNVDMQENRTFWKSFLRTK